MSRCGATHVLAPSSTGSDWRYVGGRSSTGQPLTQFRNTSCLSEIADQSLLTSSVLSVLSRLEQVSVPYVVPLVCLCVGSCLVLLCEQVVITRRQSTRAGGDRAVNKTMLASATEVEVELHVPDDGPTFFGVTWAQDPRDNKVTILCWYRPDHGRLAWCCF